MKKRFDQCPICGAAPTECFVSERLLRYPNGKWLSIGKNIAARFDCHGRDNVAETSAEPAELPLDKILFWDEVDAPKMNVSFVPNN